MAKKKVEGYLSAIESRRISRENRKITNEFEKKRIEYNFLKILRKLTIFVRFFAFKLNRTL